ncbi:MAG: hypothetical protein OEX14_10325, partial [Paracoccaceae bacterium]|nr:hypothetical protein [Paracoccaceae bacterium]
RLGESEFVRPSDEPVFSPPRTTPENKKKIRARRATEKRFAGASGGDVRRVRTCLYYDSEAVPYVAPNSLHLARAAARLSLKLWRDKKWRF